MKEMYFLIDLLFGMLVLLGEVVCFTLETLGFRFVHDSLHATTLTVAVGIVHF